jgi:hypothetical protein
MSESVTGELIGANQQTFQEHIERIQSIRNRIKKSVLEMSDAVSEAYEQLGDETFTELAKQLGMGRGTLYKWKDIAHSKFIADQRDMMPETFTSLYEIAVIEKKVRQENKKGADKVLKDYVTSGLVHPKMSIDDVMNLKTSVARGLMSLVALNQRKNTNHIQPLKSSKSSIDKIVETKKVFKTFVIEPRTEDLKKFSQDGFFDQDIRGALPIDRLTDTSIDGGILAVCIVPNKFLPIGLKMLKSWGFKYADIVSGEEKRQMLIGWRGKSRPVRLETEHDLFHELERVGQEPRISIWYENLKRPRWSSAE